MTWLAYHKGREVFVVPVGISIHVCIDAKEDACLYGLKRRMSVILNGDPYVLHVAVYACVDCADDVLRRKIVSRAFIGVAALFRGVCCQ